MNHGLVVSWNPASSSEEGVLRTARGPHLVSLPVAVKLPFERLEMNAHHLVAYLGCRRSAWSGLAAALHSPVHTRFAFGLRVAQEYPSHPSPQSIPFAVPHRNIRLIHPVLDILQSYRNARATDHG